MDVTLPSYFTSPFFLGLVALDLVLKGIALWKTSQAKRKYWFITLLLVNSMGILPLVYLLFVDKKKK